MYSALDDQVIRTFRDQQKYKVIKNKSFTY